MNAEKDKAIIGQRIAKCCADAGINQAELARRANVTEASISLFVNGQRLPSTPLLRNIAAALGVTTEFLLRGDDSAATNKEVQSALSFYRGFKQLDPQSQKFVEKQIQLLKKHGDA